MVNLGSSLYVALGVPIVFVVGVLLGIWSFQNYRRGRRTKELHAQARALGLNFEGDRWINRRNAPPLETALFGKGHTPQFKNIMTGNSGGLKVSMFDYAFAEGSGRSIRCYEQTVGAFSRSDAYFPYFELQPCGMMEGAWDNLTHKNIHFDSDADFSRCFLLRGALDDKVQSFFNPTLRELVKAIDSREKWRIEGTGDTLILYRYSKKVPPAEMRMFLDRATSIANSFFRLSSDGQSSLVEKSSSDSHKSPSPVQCA